MNRRFFTCQENRKTVKQLFEIGWKCGGKIFNYILYIINYLYYLVFGIFSLSKNCFSVFLFFGHCLCYRDSSLHFVPFWMTKHFHLTQRLDVSTESRWRFQKSSSHLDSLTSARTLWHEICCMKTDKNGHKRTKTDIGSKIIRIFVPHKTKNWRL